MKIKQIVVFLAMIVGLTFIAFGQNSIGDLKSAHSRALNDFLAKNNRYSFLSAKKISAKTLREMRGNLGKNYQPYYLAEDFNGDKRTDFAVILARKGARKTNKEVTSAEHKYDYPLAVVIFNGNAKGGFTKAAVFDVAAPYLAMLVILDETEKMLHFTVFETDAYNLDFEPKGKTYISKSPEMP